MSWMNLLQREIESSYKITEGLFDLADDRMLVWKPATGSNWMTMGQLIRHLTEGCGSAFSGLITGDWGLPPGVDMNNLSPEEMLPPAEKLPTIESVAEAKKLLKEDKSKALKALALCDETRLLTQKAPVPWDPSEMVLGHRLLQMIDHLKQHKGQLFYYLKLQGKLVNTGHLWGG
jgi:hypothetical protein